MYDIVSITRNNRQLKIICPAGIILSLPLTCTFGSGCACYIYGDEEEWAAAGSLLLIYRGNQHRSPKWPIVHSSQKEQGVLMPICIRQWAKSARICFFLSPALPIYWEDVYNTVLAVLQCLRTVLESRMFFLMSQIPELDVLCRTMDMSCTFMLTLVRLLCDSKSTRV